MDARYRCSDSDKSLPISTMESRHGVHPTRAEFSEQMCGSSLTQTSNTPLCKKDPTDLSRSSQPAPRRSNALMVPTLLSIIIKTLVAAFPLTVETFRSETELMEARYSTVSDEELLLSKHQGEVDDNETNPHSSSSNYTSHNRRRKLIRLLPWVAHAIVITIFLGLSTHVWISRKKYHQDCLLRYNAYCQSSSVYKHKTCYSQRCSACLGWCR